SIPIAEERDSSASSPPVAISAFEGMQSHRWAAPPTTSRSISVTSAPSCAATVAQVLPAGPPPMMTRRVVGTSPGYAGEVATPGLARVASRDVGAGVPELRHDALTGRLVLLAPGRRARPDTHRDAVAAGAASGASAGGSAGGSARRCPF